MRMLPLFAFFLCLFVLMLDITQAKYKIKKQIVSSNPLHRELTNKELKNMQPKIDGIPKGRNKPHPMTGKVVKKRPNIIFGIPTHKNKFAWMSLVIADDIYICGGSVISPTFVLTSGYCVPGTFIFELRMGSPDFLDSDRVTIVSTTSYIHPTHDPTFMIGDIALIELPHAIDNNLIKSGRVVPIRLPSQTQASKTFEGRKATISGWGENGVTGEILSNILNYAPVSVISNELCAHTYGTDIITGSKLCTLGKYETGICFSDFGGPLEIVECDNIHTQIGIASFRLATCLSSPSGFTRVSSYLAWISGITGLAIRP